MCLNELHEFAGPAGAAGENAGKEPVESTTTVGSSPRSSVRPSTLEERVVELLERIATSIRPCRACGVTLYFVGHTNGKLAPYTADASNHFLHCPKASEFRRRKHG
ncbi:MAG TPA: hypothetical protein VH369_22265 [Bryobacteraceae bacterium]|jgi:hypothetical protein